MQKEQVKKFHVRPQDNYFKMGFAFILLFITFFTFLKFSFTKFLEGNLIELLTKFTYESNILILLVMILFFTSFRQKKYFNYLTFIAFIDILLTFVIVHTHLAPDEKWSLMADLKKLAMPANVHFCHTIIPLLYIIFALWFFIVRIDLKKAYLGIIHPLVYYFYFLLLNLFLKNKYYPYDFMNPKKPNLFISMDKYPSQGYLGVFLTIMVLSMFFYGVSYGVLYLKNKIFSMLKK